MYESEQLQKKLEQNKLAKIEKLKTKRSNRKSKREAKR